MAGERWDNQFDEPHLKGGIDTEERGSLSGGHSFGLFGNSCRELGLEKNPTELGGQLRIEGSFNFNDWDLDYLRTEVYFDLRGPVSEGFMWIRPGMSLDWRWSSDSFSQVTTTTTRIEREITTKKIKIWLPWHRWPRHHGHNKHHKHHKRHKHHKHHHGHHCWHRPIVIKKTTVTERTITETETRTFGEEGGLDLYPNLYLQAGIGRTLGDIGRGAFWIEGGRRFRIDNWHFSLNWIFAPAKWAELDMKYEWNWFDARDAQDLFVAEFGVTITGQITKQVSVYGRLVGWVSDQDTDGVEFSGGVQLHFR